jgi:hypothetical protein
MQMDDIRGVSTICKGLVAAYDGKESKSFHQRQRKQQNDYKLCTDGLPGQVITSYYHSLALDADG